MIDLLTLGTIVVPTILIIVHFRYAKSVENIKQLIQQISQETASVEERLLTDSQLERQKVEDLLHEIDSLRKEIEDLQRKNAEEVKLRNEVEKKVELALKDNESAQKISNAILVTQKETLQENEQFVKDAIHELYQKLINHDFEEEEENIDLENSEEIEPKKEKIIEKPKKVEEVKEIAKEEKEEELEDLDNEDLEEEKDIDIITQDDPKESEELEELEELEEEEIAEEEDEEDEESSTETDKDEEEFGSEFNEDDSFEDEKSDTNKDSHIIDKFMADLIDLIKVDGGKSNKDYFLAQNIGPDKSESFECEIAFINKETLYGVDMKACLLFDEYEKSSNKDEAQNALQENLTGYIDYICDPKYLSAILSSLPSSAKYKNSSILLALESKSQIEMFAELGFASKLKEAKILLMSFKEINNLLL